MSEWNDDNERELVIKNHNRVLRRVNKALRKSNETVNEYSDSLFAELCNSNTEAELAMEKLWTLGEFQCDPRNYDFIVEMCLRALEDSETLSHRPEAAMQKTLDRQKASN